MQADVFEHFASHGYKGFFEDCLNSHETNFKGKVGDTDHIYRILPLPPCVGNERRRRIFPNAVFVTMFFLTTV